MIVMVGNDRSDEGEGPPTEHCLDALLSRLYDLGEGVSVKKNQKRAVEASVREDEPKTTGHSTASQEKATSYDTTTTCKKKHSSPDFFQTLKEELHNQSSFAKCTRTEMERDISSNAETCVKRPCVEVVRFLSQKPKKKTKLESAQEPKSKVETQEKDDKEQMFSFEKARLEVHRFGITGYKKEKQRTFEQERAIMLGAKPPKKEYLNYKVYQDQVKQTKAAKKEESVKFQESDPSKRKRKRGQEERWSKKKRSTSTVLPSGQVGKFKNGTLLLSGKDIKKIKTSKVVK